MQLEKLLIFLVASSSSLTRRQSALRKMPLLGCSPVALLALAAPAFGFAPTQWSRQATALASTVIEPYAPFVASSKDSVSALKAQVLQLAASLDRGQAYNPTSGEYYRERFEVAVSKVRELIAQQMTPLPTTLAPLDGEWELVFTSVKHGIFRSSPFFLAIQEAFEFGEVKEAFGQDKATLFFKLHELQTCSFGASKVGRVAQRIDASEGMLYSEFDTSIFSLTAIPILGFWKLLPTFGGCVITASSAKMTDDHVIEMEVDYTTSKPVVGLSGLGKWIWSVKVPVGAVWKLLPWNKGRAAACSIKLVYLDEDVRIVEDKTGDLFVYTRPVVSRL